MHTSTDNMLMTAPPKTRKPRPQSARLDILSMMMMGGKSNKQRPSSPTDSLSPCREDYAFNSKDKIPRSAGVDQEISDNGTVLSANDCSSTSINGPDDDDWFASEPACPPLSGTGKSQSTTPSVQTTANRNSTQQARASHVRRSKHSPSAAASHTSLPPQEPRCLLSRSHRPSIISVDETNGASTLPAYELKQAIYETRLINDTLQPLARTLPLILPERGRTRHRRSPAQQIGLSATTIMGNQHSHHDFTDDSAFDHADDRSTHSVLRASRLSKASRLPRRSSMNLFKRLDSKSPLPADSSRSVTEVPRAATAPNLDGMVDDDETEDEERQRSRARHAHRHSAPSPSTPMHPASPTATLTEESAARPLSPSSTITDRRDNTDIDDEEDSPAHMRVSALSPTLPLPTLIPEDSPHKYGLKDRTDTPEANSPPPPDAELAKARCRSSGLAIFKQAKKLQSASSFLNGLSTARRRAESRSQSRNATDNSQDTINTSYNSTYQQSLTGAQLSFANLPASATASTIHPYSSISQTAFPQIATEADLDLSIDTTNRNRGQPFKSSGYAYAPPISITQLKCYQSHQRLMPSRNKHAPVECAVCHADDENQHWNCTWCALRMCGGCRKVFEIAGVAGLRDRVRATEMGGY
ncbi:hypothetical protein Q7P35_000604 [Cladosporium inversicolor]